MCPGAVPSRRNKAVRAGYTGDEGAARALTNDPDPATRASATAALVRMGVASAADMDAALTDPDPSVRQRALRLLVGLDQSDVVTPNLLPYLPDPDDGVTEVAAFVAGELFGQMGAPEIGTAATIVDELDRVVTALSEIVTDHSDPLCRESAVAALGAIGNSAGLPAVLTATRDRATVRRRAVLAL